MHVVDFAVWCRADARGRGPIAPEPSTVMSSVCLESWSLCTWSRTKSAKG